MTVVLPRLYVIDLSTVRKLLIYLEVLRVDLNLAHDTFPGHAADAWGCAAEHSFSMTDMHAAENMNTSLHFPPGAEFLIRV